MTKEIKIGFTHTAGFILFIVFLILKLTKVIDWNWFWIVFPLWLPFAITLVLLVIVLIIDYIAYRRN